MTRRQVRVAGSFFERLDELLPGERGPEGTPSSTDFLLHEMPAVVDRLADDFFGSTLAVAEDPEIRVLITPASSWTSCRCMSFSPATAPSRSSTSSSGERIGAWPRVGRAASVSRAQVVAAPSRSMYPRCIHLLRAPQYCPVLARLAFRPSALLKADGA